MPLPLTHAHVYSKLELSNILAISPVYDGSLFPAGNKYTLKELPAQNDIDIHTRLKRFHRVMYGAQFMTLAVQARGMWVLNRQIRFILHLSPSPAAIEKKSPVFRTSSSLIFLSRILVSVAVETYKYFRCCESLLNIYLDHNTFQRMDKSQV